MATVVNLTEAKRIGNSTHSPRERRQDPGGGRSLYFRDPAGNSVELGTPSIWRIPDAETFGA